MDDDAAVPREAADGPAAASDDAPEPAPPPRPPSPLRRWLPLVVIALVAFGLRAGYLLEMRGDALFENPQIDSQAYDQKGWQLAQGEGWGNDRPYYQDPFYPYFLAAIYEVAGHSRGAVRWLQVLLGVGHVLIIWAMGSRLGGRWVGLLAGALAASYKLYFFYAGHVEKTAVSLVAIDGALLAMIVARDRRDRLAFWGLAGLLLGLATLIRSNVLLFAPVATLWAFFELRRPPLADPESGDASPAAGGDAAAAPKDAPPAPAGLPTRRAALAAAALPLGVLLCLLPVTIRNLAVSGELVLTTAQAGPNFYIGWHRANKTGAYAPPPYVRAHPFHEETDFRRYAESALGRELSSTEVSGYYWRAGLSEIAADPGAALGRLWLKTRRVFNAEEIADNYSVADFARVSRLLAAPLPSFALVAPLGLLGCLLALGDPRARRRAAPLLLFVPVYAGSVVLFFVFSRYRMPLVGPLIVLGAWAVVELGRDVMEERFKRFAIALPGLVLLSLAVILPPRGLTRTSDDLSLRAASRASLLLEAGQVDAAEATVAAALERDPGNPFALVANGDVLLAQGHPHLAVEQWRRALQTDPTFPGAFARLERVHGPVFDRSREVRGLKRAIAEHPDDVAARYGLASLYASQDLFFRAEPYAAAVVEREPDSARALNLYGVVLTRQRRHPEAARVLERAVAAEPGDRKARLNLGQVYVDSLRLDEAVALYREALGAEDASDRDRLAFSTALAIALERAGRYDEAIAAASAALEIVPQHAAARTILGVAHLERGDLRSAVEQLERAVRDQPDYLPARSFLKAALRQARAGAPR